MLTRIAVAELGGLQLLLARVLLSIKNIKDNGQIQEIDRERFSRLLDFFNLILKIGNQLAEGLIEPKLMHSVDGFNFFEEFVKKENGQELSWQDIRAILWKAINSLQILAGGNLVSFEYLDSLEGLVSPFCDYAKMVCRHYI